MGGEGMQTGRLEDEEDVFPQQDEAEHRRKPYETENSWHGRLWRQHPACMVMAGMLYAMMRVNRVHVPHEGKRQDGETENYHEGATWLMRLNKHRTPHVFFLDNCVETLA